MAMHMNTCVSFEVIQNGSNPNGSNMDQIWGSRNKNNGSNMDQIWCSRIKIMDQTWIQYGSSQFPRNKNNELNMDQM